jgi:hypothetical protein
VALISPIWTKTHSYGFLDMLQTVRAHKGNPSAAFVELFERPVSFKRHPHRVLYTFIKISPHLSIYLRCEQARITSGGSTACLPDLDILRTLLLTHNVKHPEGPS